MVSWKGGALLAAVLAGLGVYLFLTRPQPAPPAAHLLPCAVLNTDFVELQGGGATLELQRSDPRSEWQVLQPAGRAADHEAVTFLVSAIESLTVENTLSGRAGGADYGFGRPHLVLTCRVTGGGSYTLTVGNRSFDGSGYYAQKGGDHRVFVISGVEVDSFDQALRKPPVKPSPSPG